MNDEQRDLADRRWFPVSDEQFEEFRRLLEQPARDLPKLRESLGADNTEETP